MSGRNARELFDVIYSIAPILLPVLFLGYLLSKKYQKGLQKVPGPFLRSISSLPRILSVYNNNSHTDDIALHEKYGKLVRIAPKTLSISDPSEIAQIYGINTKFVKSDFYSLANVQDENGNYIPDPFTCKDKAIHSRLKRGAANAFSLNALVQMEPFVDPVIERLFRMLDDYAEHQASCDLGVVLKNFAMDAICSMTFGKDFNYLEKDDWLAIYHIIDVGADYMAIFGQIPWSHKYLLQNPRIAAWWVGEDKSNAEIMNLAMAETEASRTKTDPEGPMTFIHRLVSNQSKNPDSITDFEIYSTAFGNISAGSDTTGIALRSVFYYLLKNPESYKRLCTEVRENLSLPVRYPAASALPYLNACIQEAMRMHPSVGMMLAREVPQGGAIICGYHVGGGIEVGINPMVLHYSPDVFPDPYRYDPERWLNSKTNAEHLKLMNRCFLTFGHGAHTCSGRNISTLETVKLVPSILLRYDLSFADGGKGFSFKNRWFTTQRGLNVFLKRRI